jgi:protein TonB
MKIIKTTVLAALTCGLLSVSAIAEQKTIKANFDNVDEIKTVKMVEPAYPKLAIRSGTEGYVVLSYNLDANGQPVDIKVLEEHPKRVFTHSAKRALKASRFVMTDAQGTNYAVEGLLQRYDFAFPQDQKLNRTARR